MSRRAPAKAPAPFVHCVHSPGFKPQEYLDNDAVQREAAQSLAGNDFQAAVHASFAIPKPDFYVYRARADVTLAEANHVIGLGGVNGLHDWYRAGDGSALPHPTAQDIEGYISIFLPSTVTASSLKGFLSNAKKASVRASVAENLTAKRFIHPSLAGSLAIPKTKKPPSANPYLDFWAWSCRALQWCGPCDASAGVRTSHHILPVLMHHFGCVTPSHEALVVLRTIAAGRPIADVGSGNGYWTVMLRRYGLTVYPVDNMQSAWRVMWVDDTIAMDGVRFLKQHQGGRDMVMLLVYPVVGGSAAGGPEGGFTRGLVAAYEGDTLAVVGTQNRNGYTGFQNQTMNEYMEKEHPNWTKAVQIPLPSFPGKDEALFVFQRGERAPKGDAGPNKGLI